MNPSRLVPIKTDALIAGSRQESTRRHYTYAASSMGGDADSARRASHGFADDYRLRRTIIFHPGKHQCVRIWGDVLKCVAKFQLFTVHFFLVVVYEHIRFPMRGATYFASAFGVFEAGEVTV